MSQEKARESKFLIFVQPTGTAERTVEHALREARDAHTELEEQIVLDIRILVDPESPADGHRTRQRLDKTVSAFKMNDGIRSRVDVLPLSADDSADRTGTLLGHLDTRGVSRVLLDSGAALSVEQLRDRFGVGSVELITADAHRKRRALLHPGGWRRLATIFGLSYIFYLAIGGFVGGLDLVTGAISAAVVALSLSHVALGQEPGLARTGGRLLRMLAFVPVLLWEIVKANFVIAYIILHPRLPIDPSIGTIETETTEGLERMVLANSITLTPGTLVLDVRDSEFTIHALTAEARTDLEDGRFEQLVAWVFHGQERNRPAGRGGGDEV